jgi:hypothetical protein
MFSTPQITPLLIISCSIHRYIKAKKRVQLEIALDTDDCLDDFVAAFEYYWPKVRIHFILVAWVILGVVYSCLRFEWPVVDGLFFIVSILGTGGITPLPNDAQDCDKVLVAIYMCIGIPLMAVSMGTAITPLMDFQRVDISPEDLYSPVTEEELWMMRSFGIEDGNGSLDAREFIILILLR